MIEQNMQLTKPRYSVATAQAESLTNIFSEPAIPVLEIAEENGVDVIFTRFGPHTDSVAGLCDFDEGRIYVNSEEPTVRQSFTIAHELGHWLLHRKFFEADPENYAVFPRFSKPDYSDPFEKEANCFAANLLVPSRLLKPIKDESVTQLARVFGVSRTMMEFRLKNV